MIRYIWNREGRYIYQDESFKVKIPVLYLPTKDKIYVNILEKKNNLLQFYGWLTSYKVKLYCSNGEVLEGWTNDSNMFIEIENKDELFDGRFNQ